MKYQLFVLYECDAWLSRASKDLIGVFTSQGLDLYLRNMNKACIISDYCFAMLRQQKQTQGLETNYIIETVTLDPEYEPK